VPAHRAWLQIRRVPRRSSAVVEQRGLRPQPNDGVVLRGQTGRARARPDRLRAGFWPQIRRAPRSNSQVAGDGGAGSAEPRGVGQPAGPSPPAGPQRRPGERLHAASSSESGADAASRRRTARGVTPSAKPRSPLESPTRRRAARRRAAPARAAPPFPASEGDSASAAATAAARRPRLPTTRPARTGQKRCGESTEFVLPDGPHPGDSRNLPSLVCETDHTPEIPGIGRVRSAWRGKRRSPDEALEARAGPQRRRPSAARAPAPARATRPAPAPTPPPGSGGRRRRRTGRGTCRGYCPQPGRHDCLTTVSCGRGPAPRVLAPGPLAPARGGRSVSPTDLPRSPR
jgi:hypothetical protein